MDTQWQTILSYYKNIAFHCVFEAPKQQNPL